MTIDEALALGWRLVPPEPTRKMLDACYTARLGTYHNRRSVQWVGLHYGDSDARIVAEYQAILAVAPAPLEKAGK